MTTFKDFLIEDNNRAYTKSIVSKLNAATNNKHDIFVTSRTGSTETVLGIKTDDGKLPVDILNAFKQFNIGVGDKEIIKNKDGSTTLKIFVMGI